MRWQKRVAAPAFLVFSFASAYAAPLTLANGTCWMFCNSAPAPSPQPTATHATHAGQTAASADHAPRRHMGASSALRHRSRMAWKPHISPNHATPFANAAKPSVAFASHAQTAVPSQAPANSISKPSPALALGVPASDPASAVPAPAASPEANPSGNSSDASVRVLANALAEHAQKFPVDVPQPERSEMAAAAPAPSPSPPAAWRLTSFTENRPRWPATLPGRAGVWLAALTAFAALSLGGAKARGRRLRRTN
jgi:hypothetical protein